jgi:hypothetical protein
LPLSIVNVAEALVYESGSKKYRLVKINEEDEYDGPLSHRFPAAVPPSGRI